MFSWVIWFPAPGSIPADVIKTTEPWWVYESGRSNVSTAKAWESLLGRGSRTVTSIIVKSSVHSFISRWIRLRFGMRKGARNCDNAFALYAKWLSQPRKWNCSLRKVAIATAKMKSFTAQRVSQVRKWVCSLRKMAIATAIMRLSLVQTVIAFAEMKLSLRQWCFGNRDRTLHSSASRSSQLRVDNCCYCQCL